MFLGLFSFPCSVGELSLGQILLMYHSDPLKPTFPSSQCCGDLSSQTSTSFSQVQLSISLWASIKYFLLPALGHLQETCNTIMQANPPFWGHPWPVGDKRQWIDTSFSLSALRWRVLSLISHSCSHVPRTKTPVTLSSKQFESGFVGCFLSFSVLTPFYLLFPGIEFPAASLCLRLFWGKTG